MRLWAYSIRLRTVAQPPATCYDPPMTKDQLKYAMVRTGRKPTSDAIAELFGITGQAVRKWGDTIPETRRYELRRDYPELTRRYK